MEDKKIYSLGLDIGTDSVGWAVVDEKNEIVKKGDFALWGVRMFEEAKTAQERRAARCTRRRLERRKQRLNLLQSLFKEEMNKTDPGFFQRLNDSFFYPEDRFYKNKYTYFDDIKLEKQYFTKYKTIYHLKQFLINNPNEKADIRELYLAIHHIIKYRGNFLHEGDFDINDESDIYKTFDDINEILLNYQSEYQTEDEEDIRFFDTIDYETDGFKENFKDILVNGKGKTDKKDRLAKLFNVSKGTFINELIVPMLAGSKVNVSTLSFVKDSHYEKIEIDINSTDYEISVDNAKSTITELALLFDLIPNIKSISDNYYLVKLLGDKYKYISEAMVGQYDDHKKDLAQLKNLIKKYAPDQYNEVFKTYEEKMCNYNSYVGISNDGKTHYSHCNQDDFYKYIKDILKTINNEETSELINDIFIKMDNGVYLPRQNSVKNASIPRQLNEMELKKILENQSKFYPFLLEKDEDNLSVIDKIISIFEFHIPYYVGPLTNKSNHAWLTRSPGKILPWNIEKIVDYDKSAEEFIQRMQNKCTYLHGDKDYCLPKKSLLYSEYNCLNYLNKLIINNVPIDNELKKEIFENVFLVKKNVRLKDINDYLNTNHNGSKVIVKEKTPEVNCNMSSYITFKDIYKEEFINKFDEIENIIKDISIFEDKKVLEQRLKNIYKLSDDKVKEIKGLNYKGYGRLCRNLLDGIQGYNPETGEYFGTVISIMRENTMNLQEVLFDPRFNFQLAIDEYNASLNSNRNIGYKEFIDKELYIHPSMKRPLIQSYKIIDEVEKILKHKIDYYYVECTRTNKAEKKVTQSRYDKVKEHLNNCKKDAKELSQYGIDINKLNKKLSDYKDNGNTNDFKSDKLYLYYMQLGKCLYTLEDIDLDKMNNYDIDHIYPQSLIKDDSFNNRVLVKGSENKIKSDKSLYEYLSSKPNINRYYSYYKYLYDHDLISNEKYRRLTKKEFTESELDGFVNRQLVTTNQSVIGLIELLKKYKNVNPLNIIYSKAEVVSDYRKKYDILKSRTANNFHHAHDAYLNVVLGRAVNTYFRTKGFKDSYKDYQRLKNNSQTINPMVILSKDRYQEVNGEKKYYWKVNEDRLIIDKTVKERFDINETTRAHNANDMYSKQSILKKGLDDKIPVKTKDDPRADAFKYGGINSNSFIKYALIKRFDRKGNIEYVLESIPKRYENRIDEYISLNLDKKYKSFEIINPNIKIKVQIRFNSSQFSIYSKNGDAYNLKNSKDRIFSYSSIKTIKYIDKYFDLKKYNLIEEESENRIIVSKGTEKSDPIIIEKSQVNQLYEEISKIFKKSIYDYSITKTISEAIDKNLSKVYKMKIVDEVFLVNELLKHLKTNTREASDLRLIDLSKTSGRITMNKVLKPGMKLFYESVTGKYKHIIFEVPDGI